MVSMVSKVNGVIRNLPICGRNMSGYIGWTFPQEQFEMKQVTYSKGILSRVKKENLFQEYMAFEYVL